MSDSVQASIDVAYKSFTDYIGKVATYLSEDISESDTRAKFIDVFLRDVLGWQETNIRRELTYWSEGEKAAIDYIVGHGANFLVVEAKRQMIEFELPSDRQQLLYKLDGVVKSHPKLWATIQQARTYCDDNGIPFALVTNGRQFALFKAITLNKSWKSGSVAVFNLETLRDAVFSKIFKALSATNCSSTALDVLLGHCQPTLQAFRIADTVQTQLGRMCNKLTDVVEQTFAEVLRDQSEPGQEFLEHCYTMDQTTEFYAKSLQGLLHDPTPHFVTGAASAKPGHRKDPFARAMSANLERSGTRPPILLIGGKGVGKTTFINWFLKVNEFRDSVKGDVVLWIDFKGADYNRHEVAQNINRALCHQLENSSSLKIENFNALKQVFHNKIAAEKKRLLAPFLNDDAILEQKISELIGEWQKDSHAYFGELIRYATQHCNKRVIVILDNADQKSSQFQGAVHDAAQQLCADFPITLVLSLRESTYFRLSKSPRANAFSHQQIFHIRAPALAAVLRNRLSYLSTRLGVKNVSITSAAGFELKIQNVADFIDLLKRSLLDSKDAPKILELVSAVSNGSIRESLNLIFDFLVSGHTKMEAYFWEYAKNKSSCIPFHEFVGSVLLNEMAYFSERNSHSFLNIYRRSATVGDSHFTRLRFLAVVEKLSAGNSLQPEDFVRIDEIKKIFIEGGTPAEVLDAHLQALIRFGLLQANTQTSLSDEDTIAEEYAEIASLHITAAGKYYKEFLSSDYQYLLRIIPDSSIFSEKAYKEIDAVYTPYKTRDLIVPIDRATVAVEHFLKYLTTEEQNELAQTPVGSSDILKSIIYMPTVGVRAKADIEHIRRAVAAARQGGNGH